MVDGGEYRRTFLPGANRVNLFYYLREPAQRVTLDILDGKGQVVRHYEGTPASRPRASVRNSLGEVTNGPSWGSATLDPLVRVTVGLNRLAWDLKLPPATDFAGLLLRETNVDGPVMPPGQYRARLMVDGESQEQPFRVDKDPRLTDMTQQDFEAQFDFARRVHKRLNDATSSIVSIRELKTQIDERVRRAAKLRSAGEQLKARLGEVEGEIYQAHDESTSDIMHWGARITEKIGGVYGVVKSADAPPSTQVQAVFAELSPKLDAQLARLEKLLKGDVVAFNEVLRRENLPPIGAATKVDSKP